MRNLARREVVLCIVIILLIVVVISLIFNTMQGVADTLRAVAPVAPVLAVVVATGSLLVTAMSTLGGWRRNKRQATMEAWTKWSADSLDARVTLSKYLGTKVIDADQGLALATLKQELKGAEGKIVSTDDKQLIGTAVGTVLNGLERLAAGVENGVFDGDILRDLGGTIIVRSYERLKPYIRARREHRDDEQRQEKVFTCLEAFVDHLARKDLDAKRIKALSP